MAGRPIGTDAHRDASAFFAGLRAGHRWGIACADAVPSMTVDLRPIAIAVAGFCSFLDLYATQALLPLLARDFAAGATEVSLTVSATTLAIALIAPVTGAAADRFGRKRIIAGAMFALVLPTLMVALAQSLQQMVFWRFVQGLLLPPVFAVTVAYVGEEWPPDKATTLTGVYMAAGCFGGFASRFVTAVFAEHWGWRAAFHALTLATLVCAVAVAALLPRERRFVRTGSLLASARYMLRHLADPPLLATFAVGFGVLYTFVGAFTYVNFVLAAPPFGLSTAALGSVFVVYLVGIVASPMSGRLAARFGRRRLLSVVIAVWAGGVGLTLWPALWAILAGLAVVAACGFLAQSVATSFVALHASVARSSAIGLYVTCYYVGGSAGAVLPGLAFAAGGWPACVASILAMLGLMALLVRRFWRDAPSRNR
jgi:predicted MFS family arabinose efflux permease